MCERKFLKNSELVCMNKIFFAGWKSSLIFSSVCENMWNWVKKKFCHDNFFVKQSSFSFFFLLFRKMCFVCFVCFFLCEKTCKFFWQDEKSSYRIDLNIGQGFFQRKLCEKVGSFYNRGLTVDTCWPQRQRAPVYCRHVTDAVAEVICQSQLRRSDRRWKMKRRSDFKEQSGSSVAS